MENQKMVRFEAHQINGKGWTVAKIVGSKKTGRTIEIADGFQDIIYASMHQACIAAEMFSREMKNSSNIH
jgi:hypothetical protein